MDNIQHLKNICENSIQNQKIAFNKLKIGEDPYYIAPFFEGDNINFSLYAIYIQQDFLKAREYFYKAARVAQYMSDKYDRRVMDNGMFQISYAMLSDNKALIDLYSLLRNKINNEPSMPYQYSNSVQNILREDWDKLEWNIKSLTKFTKMKKYEVFLPVVDTITGFKEKDESLIKKGLEGFIATSKKRNKDYLISKFFSIDTAGFNKLAWLKGYRIDLGSPLVPAQLMPVEPLEHYEDYDFLK